MDKNFEGDIGGFGSFVGSVGAFVGSVGAWVVAGAGVAAPPHAVNSVVSTRIMLTRVRIFLDITIFSF
ncbi:MAG: hypothetical protein IPM84_17780 [Anaerolineae bacterium]|nr:hypothetical protein [Anaerolineae bacterium]